MTGFYDLQTHQDHAAAAIDNLTASVKLLMVIRNFGDKTTEDICNGDYSAAARKVPREIRKVAQRKLDMIGAAHELSDLAVPPGNRLEKLKGNLKGFHSIRINDQFRIIFKWKHGAADEVEITDYHRG